MTSAASAAMPSDGHDSALDRGLSAEEFKLAFRRHAAGVAVITADAGDGPVGITATSVFSVSAEPPLLVFSISGRTSASPVIRRTDTLVVHLLGRDQLDLARLCSTSGADRFGDTSIWRRLATGEPLFTAAPIWIRGRVVNRMEAGDSTVVAVHALEARFSAEADHQPLVYHDRTWHSLGEHSRVPDPEER